MFTVICTRHKQTTPRHVNTTARLAVTDYITSLTGAISTHCASCLFEANLFR